MAQPQLYSTLWGWIPQYDGLMRLMLSHEQLSVINEAVAKNDWRTKPAVAEDTIYTIWECFWQRLQTFARGSTPYADICQRLAWVPMLVYPKIEVPYTEKRREQTKDTRSLLANELHIDLETISAAMRAIPNSGTGTLPSHQYYYFPPEPELWIEVEEAVAEIMLGDWIWPAVDAFNILLKRTGYRLVIRGQVTDPSYTSKKESRVNHAVVLTKPKSQFIDTIVVIIEEKACLLPMLFGVHELR
ncbi:hypothetical protein EXIGLDRAFT_768190 [Exidia glandulosa HHB12029]|uniref:Uncharacterized protein n=1 Tax=Exidia glandulosa HHB12029 TaxID=1314781 RepID=A0A165IEF2_EXIGL|nr:hypothetical protein EXIGLDRAFT_768190 [Exidia glandulosa HHB12029]